MITNFQRCGRLHRMPFLCSLQTTNVYASFPSNQPMYELVEKNFKPHLTKQTKYKLSISKFSIKKNESKFVYGDQISRSCQLSTAHYKSPAVLFHVCFSQDQYQGSRSTGENTQPAQSTFLCCLYLPSHKDNQKSIPLH